MAATNLLIHRFESQTRSMNEYFEKWDRVEDELKVAKDEIAHLKAELTLAKEREKDIILEKENARLEMIRWQGRYSAQGRTYQDECNDLCHTLSLVRADAISFLKQEKAEKAKLLNKCIMLREGNRQLNRSLSEVEGKRKKLKRKNESDLSKFERLSIWRLSRFHTRVCQTLREKFPNMSEEDMRFWVNLSAPEDDEEADVVLDDSFPQPDFRESIPVTPIQTIPVQSSDQAPKVD
ncbi:hypothetical protein M5689_000090 [Euphorbia peplus]|nr:hypothetical protein M5689_000090 [Euphorbia peplus]